MLIIGSNIPCSNFLISFLQKWIQTVSIQTNQTFLYINKSKSSENIYRCIQYLNAYLKCHNNIKLKLN